MRWIGSESIVRQYYRRLFLLPKMYVIIIAYLAIGSAIGVAEALPSSELITYLNNVADYLVGFTVFLLLNVATTFSKTLNLKRVLGLTTILIGVFSIAEVVFSKLTNTKGLGVLASSGMSYIVLSVFIKHLQAFIASTLPQFLTYLVLNKIVVESSLMTYVIKAIAVQALSLIASTSITVLIEFKGRKSLGIKPISLLNSFIASWFSNNPQPIETEFEKYSESKDVLIRLTLIKTDNGENILLIFPTIHFGPFRNIGSSRLIYHLEDLLGSRYQTFVFHTPCSHERNLVASSDSERIAKYLNNNVDGLFNITATLKPCRPYKVVNNDSWEAYVIPIQTGFIAFLKNLEKGSDDLPYDVWDLIKDRGGIHFYSLVDTHSSKGNVETNLEVFKDLLDRIVSNYRCEEVQDFSIGYSEGYVNPLHRGLCYNKVKSLVMDFNGSKHVIVYLYGNNMDREFRNILTSEILSLGVEHVEVITPDDHSCAASFKESPYDIISCCNDLVGVVKNVVRNAMLNMSKAGIHTADVVIMNVKLVGDKVWDMVRGLDILGGLAIKYIPASLILMNLTPLITLLT
ncbi:MAG: DUF2070 family protein [Sulfolobales archaeon]